MKEQQGEMHVEMSFLEIYIESVYDLLAATDAVSWTPAFIWLFRLFVKLFFVFVFSLFPRTSFVSSPFSDHDEIIFFTYVKSVSSIKKNYFFIIIFILFL